ncbi:cysteine-rich RLK (RECEPTOR-like protein kinase) 8 [Hibiscus trionum]|uniref:Cysteine-rich RLK (RECEPTOR-like protein kinase) 8 n=1 Tax=Hibiscus trionum TaxID=183268 RepID=A0A9W7LNH7_HIBTR|nr:cysteine-rich RLK (RECEPTOR-like protein kinase) 8 [Hibiscus trionum]
MDKANSASTLMLPSVKLSENAGSPIEDVTGYWSIVGALLYLCHTGPDVMYSVHRVAQYMHRPCEEHLAAVKRILRYLNGTLHYGLVFRPSEVDASLVVFSDADWGSSPDDRRSTSGYCAYLGNNILTWSSRKQKEVSRSTMEAEYRSIADAVSEVTWLRSLLTDMGVQQKDVPVVWSDSTSAISLSMNPVFHSQSKHVDLDVHFVREKIADNSLRVNYVPASHQTADGFTKALTCSYFDLFRQRLNVVTFSQICGENEKSRGNVKL